MLDKLVQFVNNDLAKRNPVAMAYESTSLNELGYDHYLSTANLLNAFVRAELDIDDEVAIEVRLRVQETIVLLSFEALYTVAGWLEATIAELTVTP